MKALLKELYRENTTRAVHFRYALLAFDAAILLYLFISSFFYGTLVIEVLDAVVGIFVLTDVAARFAISERKALFFVRPYGIADLLTVLSLLLPLWGESLAFLRVVRAMRLLRSYEVMERLRLDFPWFRKHEDVLTSMVNLFLFIFVMTAIVFETQVRHNPQITNYIDALYFTVTTLTTTGFGDITLKGDSGKMIAVAIMIFGVSLFIRLIQTVFRRNKVRFPCPDCGLLLHDIDAVHCKHCGKVLAIANEGVY